MKILIIDNLAVKSSRREIYRELAKKNGEAISLLVPDSWKEQGILTKYEEEKSDLLKVYSSPFLFGYRHQRIIYTKLKSILELVQPEVVFISSEPENFNTYHLVRLVNKYFQNIKIVCATWRNIDYRFNAYPYKLGFLNKIIERYTIKKINLCVAHSYSAVDIMRQISSWEIVFVPPAIDLKIFTFNPLGRKDYVVGYIGRLSKEKGVDILIKAISKLDITCLIVGRGAEKNYLKSLASDLGIADKITWVDAVQYEEVPLYLNQIQILVLPSRTTRKWKEQFGRILIEAMASGVYVIGANSGDIPKVVGEYGFLFKEEDVDELSNLIVRIKNNQVPDELLLKARKMVEENYSIEKAVNVMYESFRKLVQKNVNSL